MAAAPVLCPNPDNTAAERSMLGAVLLDPFTFGAVSAILAPHQEAVFLDVRHRALWAVFRALVAENRPIDPTSILDYVSAHGVTEDVGGAFYGASLTGAVPTSANVEDYARAVRARFDRESIRRAASQLDFNLVQGDPPDVAVEAFNADVQRIRRTDEWPPPRPLPDGPSVEPFDEALLPDTMRPWIGDIAERMQCPPDFPAAAFLVLFGSVVGRQIAIRPKRYDDWQEVPNLWGGIVGPPGVLKSPALAEILKPLKALEARTVEEYKSATHDAEAAAMVAAIGRKDMESQIKKALKAGDHNKARQIAGQFKKDEAESAAPACRRYMCNSATVESLGVLLTATPSGILFLRDELSGFLRAMEKQGQEEARAFYLEAWNGKQGFTYDRIGRGTTRIGAATVSVFGTIQPGPLTAYLRENCHGGGNDGLIPRFQIMVFPDLHHEFCHVDRLPDTQASDSARALFEAVDCLDVTAVGAVCNDGPIPYLRFDDTAQEMFDEWRGNLEIRLRDDSLHPMMQEHLAKYRGLVPSIALLMHLADGKTGPVGRVALLKALLWAVYLESHARRVYGLLLRSEDDAARLVLHRIKSGALSSPFSERDVYRNQWGGLDKTTTGPALAVLEEHGYVRSEDVSSGAKGGRSTRRYHIHPDFPRKNP